MIPIIIKGGKIFYSKIIYLQLIDSFEKIDTFLSQAKYSKEIIDLLSSSKYLGSGEFSDAYQLNEFIIKINRDISKYNPHNFTREQFLKISKEEMQSEIKTFELLKQSFSDILPERMKGYEIEGRYFILRSMGIIPIDRDALKEEVEKRLLGWKEKTSPDIKTYNDTLERAMDGTLFPKWILGSISQDNYNYFARRLYELSRDIGYFDDILQIALDDNGKAFLMDLGRFVLREDYWKNYGYIPETDQDLITLKGYDAVRRKLGIEKDRRLDGQVGINHKIPHFVIDFHIYHYTSQLEKHKNNGMDLLASLNEDHLNYWIKIKNDQSQNLL